MPANLKLEAIHIAQRMLAPATNDSSQVSAQLGGSWPPINTWTTYSPKYQSLDELLFRAEKIFSWLSAKPARPAKVKSSRKK